jgi:16S rRNA G966 N2-methylase RsmD
MKATHTNADMSHQNGLLYKLSVLSQSLKSNGISETLRKLWQRIEYKRRGIDFATQNIYDLTRIGEYQDHGTALVSTSIDFMTQLLKDLEEAIGKPLDRELFVDYGSGKGAAIIHAKKLGFKQTIGIEFAKELNDQAIKNIELLKLDNVSALYADATSYTLEKNISLIYFFNPFDEVVMQKVIDKIVAQKDSFENDVYIIYANASCNILRDSFQLLNEIVYVSGAKAEFYQI